MITDEVMNQCKILILYLLTYKLVPTITFNTKAEG